MPNPWIVSISYGHSCGFVKIKQAFIEMKMFPFTSRNNHEIHAVLHIIMTLITIESRRLFYDYRAIDIAKFYR